MFRLAQNRLTIKIVISCLCISTGLLSLDAISFAARGCTWVTPPGDQEPVCCINGVVFLDGERVEGATITIETDDGELAQQTTNVDSNRRSWGAFYEQDLTALGVKPLDTIIVTASYGGKEKAISYTVQAGGQRVDIVLPSKSTSRGTDYILAGEIWNPSDNGRLKAPHNAAINSKDELIVLDTSNARIQIFDQGGQYLRGWGTRGSSDGEFLLPLGLAVDADDNIYVADTLNNRIQKFSGRGTHISTFGDSGQLRNPEGVAIDSAGNIYVSDTLNHRIRKYDAGEMLIAEWGARGNANGEFIFPTALAVDSQDNLHVADWDNDRVQLFSSAGQYLSKIDGFNHPDGLALDANGNLYVSDANHHVQVFDTDGSFLREFGERGSSNGELLFPKGMAVSSSGTLYVADEQNDRIHVFDGGPNVLELIGFDGSNQTRLSQPGGSAVDSSGNLYVADTENNRIQLFDADGEWIDSFGTTGTAAGQFITPMDIAFDSTGNRYVVDQSNGRIQKFDSNNGFLLEWGVSGTREGEFSRPSGIAIDTDDQIYIADTYNNRIQVFTASGEFIRMWGRGVQSGGSDFETCSAATAPCSVNAIGGVVAGHFNAPQAVAVGQGRVYVADTSNHRIQSFTLNGTFVDQFGDRGSLDGQFNSITDLLVISVNNADHIYAADETGRVQTFNQNGEWIAKFGGEGNLVDSEPALFGNIYDSPLLRLASSPSGQIYVTDTVNDRVIIFRTAGTGKPIATINWVESTSLSWNETLKAEGMGQDSDSNSTTFTYEWRTDASNGVVSNANTLDIPTTLLGQGQPNYEIELRVKDAEGNPSDWVRYPVLISVDPRPVQDEAPPQPWTMLLYLAGDYHDNGQQFARFKEALDALCQRVTTNQTNIRAVALLDGPGVNDTQRWRIDPTAATCSDEFHPDGEQAMDDPETLRDFIGWGQEQFPASRYYLAIADHGQGINGIAWDTTSDLADNGTQDDSAYLTVKELRSALQDPAIHPVSVIHLDACSMNLAETAFEFSNALGLNSAQIEADDENTFLISSQYLGWDFFAYDRYAETMTSPDATAREVATAVADLYASEAERIKVPYTISVLNLDRTVQTVAALDELAAELIAKLDGDDTTNRPLLDSALQQALHFESNNDFINDTADIYVDLGDWTAKIKAQFSNSAIQRKADALINELQGNSNAGGILTEPFIVHKRAQTDKLPVYVAGGALIPLDNASGISIFYPPAPGGANYDNYVNQDSPLFEFAQSTSWASFLIKALDGKTPDPRPVIPPLPVVSPSENPSENPLENPSEVEVTVLLPLITR